MRNAGDRPSRSPSLGRAARGTQVLHSSVVAWLLLVGRFFSIMAGERLYWVDLLIRFLVVFLKQEGSGRGGGGMLD